MNPSLAIKLGFRVGRAGAHGARTLMLTELEALLEYVGEDDVPRARYRAAIVEENCLGKRSTRTRNLSHKHLVELYSLDPGVPLFKAFLYYWRRDVPGRPLLALLLAYARDPVLRITAPFIVDAPEGAAIGSGQAEEHIERREPDRFSAATLKSTAQNTNASWTRSGHLTGQRRKVRSRALATPGSTAYALLLGYVLGVRGAALFETEYAVLLDCPRPRALELAAEASRRGWLVFKRVGTVVEVVFPGLISITELEALGEQD